MTRPPRFPLELTPNSRISVHKVPLQYLLTGVGEVLVSLSTRQIKIKNTEVPVGAQGRQGCNMLMYSSCEAWTLAFWNLL